MSHEELKPELLDLLKLQGGHEEGPVKSEEVPKVVHDLNILLLGETGVGKSTFINAIANYFHFDDFEAAVSSEESVVLIPATITVLDKNFEPITVNVGEDNNEYREVGASATQKVRTYVFPLDDVTRVRLIDTPGLGDPRGIQQDDENCQNILDYLSQLQEVHSICIILTPTVTRLTVQFEYCIKQILSRLEKTASRNICFVFTNTRGNNYTPGETLLCLKKFVADIKARPPFVEIPLGKANIFCLDNEAFKGLVAVRHEIDLEEGVRERYVESWQKSEQESSRLITYMRGDTLTPPLKPHQIQNSVSINEARNIITQLARPLAEVSQLIDDNIRILKRHTANLQMDTESLKGMKGKLFIPVIDLEVTALPQPVTVCASAKCTEIMQVGSLNKPHYKQRCHNPCYLNNIPKEIVGDPGLINCAAMNGTRNCVQCSCAFNTHMHVYYDTTPKAIKIEDAVIKKNITSKEEAMEACQNLIEQIETRKTELEAEHYEVVKTIALFAHFLQHNAITPFNDSYAAYIKYLIKREEAMGASADFEVIYNLQRLMQQYEEIKAAFEASLRIELTKEDSKELTFASIDAGTVFATVRKLYNLKHNGAKIKEMIDKQKRAHQYEYERSCEYIHYKMCRLSYGKKKKKKTGFMNMLLGHEEAPGGSKSQPRTSKSPWK